MDIYTYSEARQKLTRLLDRAIKTGGVHIRRRDGSLFILKPEQENTSPLDVPSLNLSLSRKDIVEAVHESRRHRSPLKNKRPP